MFLTSASIFSPFTQSNASTLTTNPAMHSNKTLLTVVAILAALIFSAQAQAAARWLGTNSSDWNDAGNWSSEGADQLLDDAVPTTFYIFNGANSHAILSSGTYLTAASAMHVGMSLTYGEIWMNGSAYFQTGAVRVGRSTVGGKFVMSGSAYFSSTHASEFHIGNESTGVLEMYENSVIVAKPNITMGAVAGSSGTLLMRDNAQFTTNGNFLVGNVTLGSALLSGSSDLIINKALVIGVSGTGTLVIDGDATVTTVQSTTIAATGATSKGTLQLKGGVLQTTAITRGAGNATIDFNGGTIRAVTGTNSFFNNFGNLAIYGAGVAAGKSAFGFDTNGVNVTITNTLTYTGAADTIAFEKIGSGTLTLSVATTYAGATRIAAGTLKAGVANLISNSSAVEIASGALFDANGKAQTLQNLSGAGRVVATSVALTLGNSANSTFSGSLVGMTSLTKTGTGALTLTANHSGYAATTSVNAGTLILNGANAKLGGTVNLAANTGNLGGNGTFTTVNAAGGNTITIGATHGAASAETLTITGALTLTNNTALRYDLFTGSNDQLSVGTLTRSGTSFIDLNSGLTGSFKLITATGGALATSDTNNLIATINSHELSGRTSANFSILNSNELWINIVSSNIADNKWSGTNTGSWMDTFANWQASDQLFIGGDSVVFDDTAAGTHTVSVDADVRASGMTVDTDDGYTFIGNYAIATSTIAPTVAGADGKLTKTGAGMLILANSGSNYFQNGIVLNGGTLQGNARTLGNADILNTAALVFDQTGAATYTAAITGGGSLAKINTGTLTLTNAANTYTGGINITGGVLELQNSGITTQGALNIETGASLLITNGASYTVQNALTGAGRLYISLDAPASAVNFTSGAGAAYAGTVKLGQSTFDLSGQNAAVLVGAALELAAGNVTTVGTGTQNIRNLSLSGGKLIFSVTIPPDTTAAGIISTNTLTLGTGTVQISLPAGGSAQMPDANLLSQDDGTAVTRLINATTVDGNASGLALVDQNGDPISAATASAADITQGGNTVATGTYNYGFVTDGGLGVNFRLISLTIADGQTLTLAPDTGATGVASVFSAAISGSGNLAIDATNAPVTLGVANNYTGTTNLTAGKLILGANNALGQTAALDLAANTEADFNTHSQTIGTLTTAASSTLNIGGGSLKLNHGGIVNGALTGAGALNIAGGTLAINGANAGFSATTTIANNVAVSLNNAAGLGSGVITFGGTGSVLSVNTTGADTMANKLVSSAAGAGQLVKAGSGTVTFTGDNAGYSGAVTIESGRIIATGSSNVITAAKTITIGDGAILEYNSGGATPITLNKPIVSTGTTGGLVISDNTSIVLTQTNNNIPSISVSNNSRLYAASSVANPFGSTAVVSVDATSGLVNRQTNLTIPALALNGTLWLSDPATVGTGAYGNVTIGQKLTSTGTGTLVFRTDLSRGLGDRMTIGAASGVPSSYKVIVNNTDTPNYWGVERFDLITSNDPQARFTLANEIASNTGYIYDLKQDGNAHYLNASNSISHEADAILNTASVMSADWHFELDSLSSRMGDVRRELKTLGDQRPGGNVWARGNAYHVDADAELGGYAFSQNAYGVTVGIDKAFRAGKGHVLLGAFGGFTSVDRSFDNRGDGSSDGVSGGLYLTWLHKDGWYADATAKYNQYKNDFTARDSDGSVLSSASYDNNAYGGSFEFGRYYQGSTGWWIEASAQFAYSYIEEARFTTSTGSRVVIFDSEATQYRGSIRWGKIFKDRLSLWMKTALVGTNNDCGEVRFYGSDNTMRADIDGLRMEAGFGVNYALTKRSQLYFDYEYARADYYTRPWSFNLGYRLAW